MAYWLLKTEPDVYGYADLARDGRTAWDGVANALALKHLRTMAVGDLALIYHTGDERAAVGVAEVVTAAAGEADATIKARRELARPVTLAAIKADPAFAGWDLIRLARLSVVPVPPAMWERVEALSKA